MGRKTIAILIFTLTISISSCFSLKKNNFSEGEQQTVHIITKYAGASPHEIENNITEVIERSLNSIKGVKVINSSSVEGVSSISVQFNDNVDIYVAKQLVSEQVQKIMPQLPRDIEYPVISDSKPSHFCIKISIFGP